MTAEHAFRELVALAAAGLALLLAGSAGLLTGLWGRRAVRAGAVPAAAAVAFAVAGAPAVGLAAAAAGLPLLVAAALRSDGLAAALRCAVHRLARPPVQTVGLATAGAVLLVTSVARFDAADEARTDADTAFMDRVTWKPDVRPAAGVATDAGRPVTPWEAVDPRRPATAAADERQTLAAAGFPTPGIRRGPASDQCNCHGWVFTGGRYWVTAADVTLILADNGYEPVSHPRPGDLAIYRSGRDISHTAVVRSAGDGLGVLVEGKWGWMGVFVHPVAESCYGDEYTFYRSPRTGHMLAGLGGPASASAESNGERGSMIGAAP